MCTEPVADVEGAVLLLPDGVVDARHPALLVAHGEPVERADGAQLERHREEQQKQRSCSGGGQPAGLPHLSQQTAGGGERRSRRRWSHFFSPTLCQSIKVMWLTERVGVDPVAPFWKRRKETSRE